MIVIENHIHVWKLHNETHFVPKQYMVSHKSLDCLKPATDTITGRKVHIKDNR